MPLKPDETLIPIKKTTRAKLKDMGKKSETYTDIIERLIEYYENNKKP